MANGLLRKGPVVLEPTGDILVDLLARTALTKRDAEALERTRDGVTIKPPAAELNASTGAALLINKNRIPEVDETELCSKCRGGDVVLVVNFPGDDGLPIQICRTCVGGRPPGHPLVIAFRS